MIQRILITKDKKKFYIRDINKEFHTQYGFIKPSELKKKSGKVKTNTKEEMKIYVPDFSDKIKKIKREAQIITPKDAGIIIAETGINNQSKVLEAGGGSGGLTCFLSNIAKKVITYEKRKSGYKTIKKNIEDLELSNVTLKNKDICEGISEKNIDIIILDMLEPENALEVIEKALKSSGHLVIYLPSITQIVTFLDHMKNFDSLIHIKTIEIIQREWKIEGKIARPEFRILGHTGFLTFIRKI